MLTTTGARSGTERSSPLLCMEDGDDSFVVIGSNYGRAHHPGWSANLRANPECTLTFRGSTGRFRARELVDDERQEAWARAEDGYRGYAIYEERARPRVIRLFRLEPEPTAG